LVAEEGDEGALSKRMVYCNNCGKAAPDSAKFCGGCGSSVVAVTSSGKQAGAPAGGPSPSAPCCVVDDGSFIEPQTWEVGKEVQVGEVAEGKPVQSAPNPNKTPSGTFLVQLPPNVTPGMVLTVTVPAGLPGAGSPSKFQVPPDGVPGGYVYAPLPAQPSQGAAGGTTSNRNIHVTNGFGGGFLQVGGNTIVSNTGNFWGLGGTTIVGVGGVQVVPSYQTSSYQTSSYQTFGGGGAVVINNNNNNNNNSNINRAQPQIITTTSYSSW